MFLPALALTRALTAAVFLQGLQAGPRPATAPGVDSVRIVRAARSAQGSFESFRRSRLPIGDHFSGPCDVRIGRYCYWHGDDNDDDDQPPPEPQAVKDRRDQLIRQLDSATRALPGDSWLAGQYVHYLVEAGRSSEATAFARSRCHASGGWCAALAGYAAHVAGDFGAADSAYRVALAAMDSSERCQWLDASRLLDDDLEHQFERVGCDGREAFIRRVFWLGEPLYSVSTSDLLTEHFARVTRARMAEHAASPDGEPWADDKRELVLRYGWPRWYSRTPPPFGSEMQPSITGHDAGRPYAFLPGARALDHVGHISTADWNLDDARAPTGYAPSYVRSLHELSHQIAVFRRRDSTLVLAGWDARQDTTLIGRPLDAALVLASDGEVRAITRASDARAAGRIAAAGVIDSGVVSLEVLAKKDRRAGRARIGLSARPGVGIALSDLLLYAPSEAAATDLGSVRDSMLTSNVIPTSRSVGVFWELYGFPADATAPVQFTLSVEQVGISFLRRAAERLHLSDPTAGLKIQWQEVPRQIGGIAPRGVRLDLSRLRSGRYHVALSALAVGEPTVVAEREIELR